MSKQMSPPDVSQSAWQQVLRVCLPDIQERLRHLPPQLLEGIEELRFRLHQPLQLTGAGFDQFLHMNRGLTLNPKDGFIVTGEHLARVIQVATQSSLYAVEDELSRGFVTMPGGHRIGVAGRVVLSESGTVRSIRGITSANVRVAKEYIGAGDVLRPYLFRLVDEKPFSVLVLSPPQCGKTTILRDITRQWSEGLVTPSHRTLKVSVVDERSEIAGCVDGIPQFRLGPRTDVLDGCPKAEGMLMVIRSLSPDVVVTDEIGREQDRDAIVEAAHAGVAVLASAHAASLSDWRSRPFMNDLFASKAFDRYVLLSRRNGPGTVERVFDADGLPIRPSGAAQRTDRP